MATNGRRVYATLDGLRGVAALFVAMRHMPFFHALGVSGGYLAVDLFFALSGFVMAHAYERRLASGLGVGRFMALRYVRLWPVYAIGASLGALAALLHAFPPREAIGAADVWRTLPFALAMLPGPHVRAMLYPLDTVAWSLGLELAANLLFALLHRPLRRTPVLAGAIAASGLALALTVTWFGKLDVGFTWGNAWGGMPRVLFSFLAGLAVYRLHAGRTAKTGALALAPLAAIGLALWRPLDAEIYPLVCVIVGFPLLLLASARLEPGPRLSRAFAWLGAASYPIYALHRPASELLVLGLYRTVPFVLDHRLPLGVLALASLAAASVWIERRVDQPIRARLTSLVLVSGRPGRPSLPSEGLASDLRR